LRPLSSTLFPYTTLFRSEVLVLPEPDARQVEANGQGEEALGTNLADGDRNLAIDLPPQWASELALDADRVAALFRKHDILNDPEIGRAHVLTPVTVKSRM